MWYRLILQVVLYKNKTTGNSGPSRVFFLWKGCGDVTAEAVALIGIVCTVCGVLIGYWNVRRENDNDIKDDAEHEGELKADVKYIRRGIEDIRVDLKAQEMRHLELSERVTRVEESAKSAHRRIDNLGGGGKT